MVLPLIPIAIAGAGLGGGFGLGSWFARGKKEIHAPQEYYAPTISVVEAAPYQTYAPQLQFAPITSYAYQGATTIISSPGAVAKKIVTQDIVSKPEMKGEWDIPTIITQEPSHVKDIAGTNLTHIALIAVVGAAAIMLLKKKKK